MGCYVLQKKFLQFFEGKIGSTNYEFGCETRQQNVQKEVSYFIYDLDDLLPKQIQQLEDNNKKMVEMKQVETRNIIAGILYCDRENVAEQFKSVILTFIRNSIYFQQGQYQEGFKNLTLSFQDYLNSSEHHTYEENNGFGKIRYHTVANLLMRTDNDIFVSKSIKDQQQYTNEWCIQETGILKTKYRMIDTNNDLIEKSEGHYQIKQGLTKNIKEIILFSSLTKMEKVTADVRNIYPNSKADIPSPMFFLKLIN